MTSKPTTLRETLLRLHLELTVNIELSELRRQGGPSAVQLAWMTATHDDVNASGEAARSMGDVAQWLAAHGDDLLFGGDTLSPQRLAELARAIALVAYTAPDGITLFGLHFGATSGLAAPPPEDQP